MATATKKEVSLNSSFNYENDKGEQKYFVRENQHEILDFVAPADLDRLVGLGVLTVTEVPVTPVAKVTNRVEL